MKPRHPNPNSDPDPDPDLDPNPNPNPSPKPDPNPTLTPTLTLALTLTLTLTSSFESARAFVEREHGRLDALVNNAAVCYNDPTLYGKVAHTPFEQQAAITLQTNYHGADLA